MSIKIFSPRIPGDKSLSHRCLMMASLCHGESFIENLSQGNDVQTTRQCLEQLGVCIRDSKSYVKVGGRGFKWPDLGPQKLNCGNSGTTMRLLLGLLHFQSGEFEFTGDDSLLQRPMDRVLNPLSQMQCGQKFAYDLPIASAQVKSALLLAGAVGHCEVTLTGKTQSRDHSERLIPFIGGEIQRTEEKIYLPRQARWQGFQWRVPGDPSAASFWLTWGVLSQGVRVQLEDVLLNPTRIGFIETLKSVGTKIKWTITEEVPEPRGDLVLESSGLNGLSGFHITGQGMPFLLDEVPLLAFIATQISGESSIRGAKELKYKESNRLKTTQQALKSVGLHVDLLEDGFLIRGPQEIKGGVFPTFGDHRLCMLGHIVSLLSDKSIGVEEKQSLYISDPHFLQNYARVKEMV